MICSMKVLRIITRVILILVAINALGGGLYGMLGAKDIPLSWLEGSPFRSYFFPSLFLFVVIGGSCLAAAILSFKHHRYARAGILFCGILLVLWIVVQVSVIGFVSWLQPAVFVAGIILVCTPSTNR